MIIVVAALVPMVGPEMVFGPVALYYLLTQDYITGLALLAFGIIFLTIIPITLFFLAWHPRALPFILSSPSWHLLHRYL